MNFYLNLLDDKVRLPHENPSIGIILCKTRDRLIVEYALRGVDKPMGVAEYYLTRELPEDLAGQLPSPEEIEARIEEEIGFEDEGSDDSASGVGSPASG